MSQITFAQRYTISAMLRIGESRERIAEALGKSKSSIYREIARNQDRRNGDYKAELAQKKCEQRHKIKKKKRRFTEAIKEEVSKLISKEQYSPEQVTGSLRTSGKDHVSHECIYQFIWEDKRNGGELHTHLRRQGRRYRKRGNSKDTRGIIKDRVSIDHRPERVELREEFGDLEVDLIIGKNHKGAILTINDRSSGAFKMRKVESKHADVVTKAIICILQDWKPFIKTITADNGKEFAGHKQVAEELEIDYYFAHPYHSWERGSNENLNGLIRQYIPKKTDFSSLTNDFINRIENKINNRPRKRFNFKTPIFVMNQLLFNKKVAFIS